MWGGWMAVASTLIAVAHLIFFLCNSDRGLSRFLLFLLLVFITCAPTIVINSAFNTVGPIRPMNLKGENLSKSNLTGLYLEKANLEEADLKGARIWRTNLRYGRLQYATLSGAHLWRANLRNATLQGADLKEPISLKRI